MGKRPGVKSRDTRSSAIFTKIQEDATNAIKQTKESNKNNFKKGTNSSSSNYKL